MKKNIGNTDKIIRIVIALALAILYFTGNLPGVLGIILAALAIILVVTSFVSFCPLYLPFGISTLGKAAK